MTAMQALAKRAACPDCLRAQRTCICNWRVKIEHDTEVVILQHPLEVHQAKGTARLLHLCLPKSRIAVSEEFDAQTLHSLLHDPWPSAPDKPRTSPSPHPVLLYPPAAGAISYEPEVLHASLADHAGPCRLIVLDGTWRKSRKMLHLNPVLEQLPRLSLSDLPPSTYHIRKAHRPDQLSTLEAACHALMRLERNAERFQPLLNAFAGFVAQHEHIAKERGQPGGRPALWKTDSDY
jgi:DTW domain-containing protein